MYWQADYIVSLPISIGILRNPLSLQGSEYYVKVTFFYVSSFPDFYTFNISKIKEGLMFRSEESPNESCIFENNLWLMRVD